MRDGRIAAVIRCADAHREDLPGEAGGTITAGYAETRFGTCLVAECPRGICHLSFEDANAWNAVQAQWPHAEVVRDDEAAEALCGKIFEGDQMLQLYVQGTPFQIKVWQALRRIPKGQRVSYGQLAKRIGKPTAARAVGTAVGSNPIGFLIPCHRVIRENGSIGGYRWGPDRKRALLAWEQAAR